MKIKSKDKLLSCLNKKSEKLKEYYNISKQINDSSLENIAINLANRQMIIVEIDKLTEQIKKYISSQSSETSKKLEDILFYKTAEETNDFKEFSEKAKEIESVLISISENENLVKLHMDDIKIELVENMKKSASDKKIIDFYNSVTNNSFNGNKFNVLN